jgi:hypothetical protein
MWSKEQNLRRAEIVRTKVIRTKVVPPSLSESTSTQRGGTVCKGGKDISKIRSSPSTFAMSCREVKVIQSNRKIYWAEQFLDKRERSKGGNQGCQMVILSYQKSRFGYISEGLGMNNFWYIVQLFGIFYGLWVICAHLIYFSTVW